MAEAAALHRSPRLTTQRLAWGVILCAFAFFCVFCLFAGLGMNYFLFQSTISLPSVVIVGRGTIGLTGPDAVEQAERRDRVLYNSAALTTDPQSQANISILDPQDEQRLIASITVDANSALTLRSVTRPRFNWSAEPYHIELDEAFGAADVFIPEGLTRTVQLSIMTRPGARLLFGPPGQYHIIVTDQEVRVDNSRGGAAIVNLLGITQSIPPGQRGVLNLSQSQNSVVMPSYTNLLGNSDFQQTNSAPSVSGEVRQLPLAWGCNDAPQDAPSGSYALARVDGRMAMLLLRGNGAVSHGETSCAQYFGPPGSSGRDITEYGVLSLRATFKVVDQSLTLCGDQGSECPFMLDVSYVDVNGVPQRWYHGFYARVGQGNAPARCDSCAQEHEYVNFNAWYTYDSDNLYSLMSPDERPASIQSVRFYASGHQYQVYVNEVSLLAGQTENATSQDIIGG